jgi:hypothetical protein
LPPELRRVVLDEDIPYRLAYQLRSRGRRDATALHLEGIDEQQDGAVVKALTAYEPFVLVTWDNKMPLVHRTELDHHGTTLAVVNEAVFKRRGGGNAEHYIRDVVHRWLHRIEVQPAASRRFYSPGGVTTWTPPAS